MNSLIFSWEKLSVLLDEPNLGDLIRQHWDELGVHKDEMPLDPDWQAFVRMEDAGRFRVWTARDEATLVGYIGTFIQPHLHYRSTLTATEDLFMLAPPYRNRGNGSRFFTSWISALSELGVRRIICHDKLHFEAERGGLEGFFKRLGFEETDRIWSRILPE
jgi:GNAT superfamily N-acetyltransferase